MKKVKEIVLNGAKYFVDELPEEILHKIEQRTIKGAFPEAKWIVLTNNKVNIYNKKYVNDDLHWYIKNVLTNFPQPTRQRVIDGMIWSTKEAYYDTYNYYTIQSRGNGCDSEFCSFFVYQNDNHKTPKTILTKCSTVFEEVLITSEELCMLYEMSLSNKKLSKVKHKEEIDNIGWLFTIYNGMKVTWKGKKCRTTTCPELKTHMINVITKECSVDDLKEAFNDKYDGVISPHGIENRDNLLALLNTIEGFSL